MKKLFTFLTLLLCVCGRAWADTAIISPANMTSQASGTLESTCDGNVWYGNGTNLASGFIIQITGNKGKALINQSTVNISNTSYASFKNSKGAQNTITLPTGYTAKSVTFYVTSNDDNSDATLTEINGTSCSDAVTSHKDGANPTVITKTLNKVNSFTFTFSTKQVFFVAVVTYQLPQPDITTQPASAAYQKDATATALSVVATASKGELSYQWYSCDDANKTNAAAIGGATSASYTPATSATGTSYYFCRVTDGNGSADSNVATITVANAYAPSVTTATTSVEVYQYETANLGVTVDALPAATIQWYSCDDTEKANAAAIDGATSTTYSPSTATTGTYYFYAVATNAQGSASSSVITLTVNEDLSGTTLYSWNAGTQTGGTISCPNANGNIGESIITNAGTSGTYTGTSSKYIKIDLNKTLKAGDQIRVTGYRNKADNNKTSGFACTFSKDGGNTLVSTSNMLACSTGYEFPNIASGNYTDSNKGTEAATVYFTVPSTADGSNAILITRSHTSTNTFFSKIEVYRPTINFKATLNAAGLLTSDEISNKTAFSFGVTSVGNRVAVDAPNAVATISGTYHNDHGCTGLTVTADVTNPVKITIGQCTYSKSQVTIKNSSNNNVALLKPNSPDCWKNDASKVDVFYYTGEATTLTISGMSYCPYVAIEEIYAADAFVSITPSYERTTYVSTMPLNFSSIEGLKAYKATEAGSGSVKLDEVGAVPAGTPLMLIGTASTKYTIPVAASADAIGTNLLQAGDGTTEFDGNTFDYILFTDGKFYQIGEGTVATNKAYLHCEADPTVQTSRSLKLVFGNETTGIGDATRLNDKGQMINDTFIYNLSGQRVKKAAKGLYIKSGKKYVVK